MIDEQKLIGEFTDEEWKIMQRAEQIRNMTKTEGWQKLEELLKSRMDRYMRELALVPLSNGDINFFVEKKGKIAAMYEILDVVRLAIQKGENIMKMKEVENA